MNQQETWTQRFLGNYAGLERINLQGTTIIMATHNSTIVNNLRHRVVAIEEGRIVRDEEEGEYGYHD